MLLVYLYVVSIYNLFCSAVLDSDYIVTELIEIVCEVPKSIKFHFRKLYRCYAGSYQDEGHGADSVY
jgi:hypothetical protein